MAGQKRDGRGGSPFGVRSATAARRAAVALVALSVAGAGAVQIATTRPSAVAVATEQADSATATEELAAEPLTQAQATARAEAAADAGEPEPESVVEGHLIVETVPGQDDAAVLAEALDGTGMRVMERLMAPRDGFGGMYLVGVPAGHDLADARASILGSTKVYGVSYDIVMRAEDTAQNADPQPQDAMRAEATSPSPYANDPGLATKWEDDEGFLNFQGAWDVAYDAGWRDSSSVTVAVLDSGIKADHEDLAANIVGTYDATGVSGMGDLMGNSHGTAVAGIISSVTNNSKGTASLSYNARLLPIQVFRKDSDDNVGAAFSDVARGMEYLLTPGTDGKTPAQRHNVKVANLSVGAPTSLLNDPSSTQVESAIERLHSNGIVLVNSMGNVWKYTDSHGQQQTIAVPYSHWPTEQEGCVGVIALVRDGMGTRRRPDSNYNLNSSDLVAKVSAPGSGIYTTATAEGSDSYTSTFSGTSAAAPQVSSLLALMYAVSPDMTEDEATAILYKNTKPTLDNDKAQMGNGMIDPVGAVTDAVHDAQMLDDLASMTATTDGSAVPGFSYRIASYGLDYGQVSPSKDLPSEVTITAPSGWTVSPNPQNPLADTHDKSVAADGTTTGTRGRTLEYTVSSSANGAAGKPLTRTYRFSMSSAYTDTSTKYETVLAGVRLIAGGKEQDGFSPTNSGPYRIMLDPSAISSAQPPSFSGVPEGWTQTTSSPSQATETIDRGDGTSVLRTSKTYTMTLARDAARLTYTVVLYSDAEATDPHGEDSSGDQSGSQSGDGQQGGESGGSQGGSGSQQSGDASGDGSSQGQAKSQQQATQATQQQQQQQATPAAQQKAQQRSQSNEPLRQTGDAVVPACAAAIAASVAGAVAAGRMRGRRDA